MEVLARTELEYRKEEIIDKILRGSIFIYPTDTIYGIGCVATNTKAVASIRRIKERENTPFSIIAPSVDWVKSNCSINAKAEEWINRFPGPFTLILPVQGNIELAENVNPNKDTLGIRIPDHWIAKLVEECGVPIVTTSANKTGQKFMTSVEDLDAEVEKEVEFMIYEGPKEARPSKIVNVQMEEVLDR
tara:strand:+ start:9898 stop:10464 length:567 start_codon:yes stop_codon:yes gene_type:complete